MTTRQQTLATGSGSGIVVILAKFRELGILFFLALLMIIATIVEPRFFSIPNFQNILLDISILTIVACGQTMVIISRNIDISVGSSLGLCAILVGLMFKFNPGVPIAFGLLMGIALGIVLGSFNGALVTQFKVPSWLKLNVTPFIVVSTPAVRSHCCCGAWRSTAPLSHVPL